MRLVAMHGPLLHGIEVAFRRAAEEVRGDAAEHAPVGMSSGMKLNVGSIQGGLRASLTVANVRHDAGGWHASVGSALRYALMREKGGIIRAVRAPFLKWRDPSTGRWYQKKMVVQRPGGPRQGYKPYLGPAGDRFPSRMDDHLRALG